MAENFFKTTSRIIVWSFGIAFIYLSIMKTNLHWDEIQVLKEQVKKLELHNKVLRWQTKTLFNNSPGFKFQWLDYED